MIVPYPAQQLALQDAAISNTEVDIGLVQGATKWCQHVGPRLGVVLAQVADPGVAIQPGSGNLAAAFQMALELGVECGQPVVIREVVGNFPKNALGLEPPALPAPIEQYRQW